MSPDEEVQITVTRLEAVRMHAALAALCELQKMHSHAVSALALDDSVATIEGILPRLAECWPDEIDDSVEALSAEAKSYSAPDLHPFDIKVDDLRDLTPAESAVVFGTEYDEAIRALLNSLREFTDFSKDDFNTLLEYTKVLLSQTVSIPPGLTVQQSMPYVKITDLTTLGALAYEMYQRQDQVTP
jgi:hypothetical protein